MNIRTETFEIETSDRIEFHNVMDDVERQLEQWEATNGLVHVRTGHSSAALTMNEPEARLLQDMLYAYTDLIPPDDWYFHDQHHINTDSQRNAFGHILSSMIRRPVVLILEDGELRTGTYEEILFLEFDGPRPRTFEVSLLD